MEADRAHPAAHEPRAVADLRVGHRAVRPRVGPPLAGEMPEEEAKTQMAAFRKKAIRQFSKDFVLFPALSAAVQGPRGFLATAAANLVANLVRNVWSHAVIFCGHFPEPTETFEEERLEGETRGEWYVRQMLGSANLSGGKVFHIMTGNLCHQIEHHSSRTSRATATEIAPKVREICKRNGLNYTTGPLTKQYFKVLRKISRHALPGGK